jgi:hypothetical protein
MTDAEKAMVKEMMHEAVDKFMPALIQAEEGRLPVNYQGLVSLVLTPLLPQLQAYLDGKIDAM